MIMQQQDRSTRRGIVLPFVGLLIVVLLVMVAFAADIGMMTVAKTELQATADSAALAAVQELLARELLEGQTNPTTGLENARTQAIRFCEMHKAGGGNLTLDRNTGNSADGDIVFGFVLNSTTFTGTLDFVTMPVNSVKVVVHRDTVRNAPLDLFFARAFGTNTANLSATAIATIDDNIRGFKIPTSGGPSTVLLLPFALDIKDWTDKIINGNGQDAWSHNANTNLVTPGGDGIHEVRMFPTSANGAGNFGTLDIGPLNNGVGDLMRQILYGPNATDLAYYANAELTLNSGGTLTLTGDTGISASIVNAVTGIIGQPRALPLYRVVSGSGDNATFTIVGFAGVVVLETKLQGKDMYITVQPAFVKDPTALNGGTSGSSSFIRRGIVLSR